MFTENNFEKVLPTSYAQLLKKKKKKREGKKKKSSTITK